MRDELCDRAWEVVCAQGDEHRLRVEKSMDDVCDARSAEVTL